jgi:glutathione transport system permease protein
MLVFAVQLGWLPVSGARSWSAGAAGADHRPARRALVARVTRVSMLETWAGAISCCCCTPRACRTAAHPVRHVLRHALMPVVTILSLRIGWIVGGAVTVEVVSRGPAWARC